MRVFIYFGGTMSDLPSGVAEIEYSRFRRDIGASEDFMNNEDADLYFVEAAESYPNNTAKMKAYARVLALTGIRASSAILGKYAQDQSEEDLTKVFDNLTIMLNDATAKVGTVTDPAEDTGGAFFFGVAQGQRGR
jgi:hypothetical protein